MAGATNRLKQELKSHNNDPTPGITAGPVNDDLHHWQASILGPAGTPYEGGLFHLDIIIPDSYPYTPPKIKFTTRVYHPNINEGGAICLDILKTTEWSPALTIPKILLSLSSLLADPNPKDPLVPDVAREMIANHASYVKNAKKWTEVYAKVTEEKKK